jgi:hypothetical protein
MPSASRRRSRASPRRALLGRTIVAGEHRRAHPTGKATAIDRQRTADNGQAGLLRRLGDELEAEHGALSVDELERRARSIDPPSRTPAVAPSGTGLHLTFRTSRDRYGPPLQLASVVL